MDKGKLEYRDPSDLMLHRFLKQLPEPNKTSSEWTAFVNNVRARGVVEPLLITADNLVMSGGDRWRAARQIELDEVPCLVRPESEAAAIIVDGLLQRRHMTRGAAVYLALGFLKDYVESAESRRLANLRHGRKNSENPLILPKGSNSPSEVTIKELCERWGIDPKTYQRAREVRELFEKRPQLRKLLEPQLLSGEKNLWNILSAAGGSDADQSQREFGVLRSAFGNFRKCGAAWKKLSREDRAAVEKQWREDAAELPQELRNAIAEVLMEEVEA